MSMAIKNAIKSHPSGQIIDGSMGITLTLSPTSSNNYNKSHLWKAILTNASFRSKKLPDDIPIVTSTSTSASGSQLISINEDNNEISDKDKDKDKLGGRQSSVLNLLKDRKEKRKDSKTSSSSKHNSSSSISKMISQQKDTLPDVIYKPNANTLIIESTDLCDIECDLDLDSCAISDTKSENYSSDHESISLIQYPPQIKTLTSNNNMLNSEDYDKSSMNDGSSLPLIKQRNENSKMNESIKV